MNEVAEAGACMRLACIMVFVGSSSYRLFSPFLLSLCSPPAPSQRQVPRDERMNDGKSCYHRSKLYYINLYSGVSVCVQREKHRQKDKDAEHSKFHIRREDSLQRCVLP